MSRSKDARRLMLRLETEAGVPVRVSWDSSAGSGGWRWHVSWADGPTVSTMQAHVERVRAAFPDLDPAALAYLRTVQPRSVALAMLGNVAAGMPALGAHNQLWLLEQELDDLDYPEQGEPEEVELAGLLLDRYGGLAAALHAELTPPGNVRALHSRRVKPGEPQQ